MNNHEYEESLISSSQLQTFNVITCLSVLKIAAGPNICCLPSICRLCCDWLMCLSITVSLQPTSAQALKLNSSIVYVNRPVI